MKNFFLQDVQGYINRGVLFDKLAKKAELQANTINSHIYKE